MERSAAAPEAANECSHCCVGKQGGTHGAGHPAHQRRYQKGCEHRAHMTENNH